MMIGQKLGLDRLRDPNLNKGTAFTLEEREKYQLQGFLPPGVHTQEEQLARALDTFRRKSTDLEKYIYLFALQSRNRQLFYRLVMENIHEIMPIIYTPTVGKACKQFGAIFRQPMGFYLTAADRGRMREYLQRWPHQEIRVIVITDGERILGLGDLGAHGMGIPIGKLSLYVACAGVHPTECLPIMLDVGTNNQELLDSSAYLGLRQTRVRGQAYEELVEEFVDAVQVCFPKALIQFEDFITNNAIGLLKKYRDRVLCFNDDIQGTAAVALGGVLAATRITGDRFRDMRFLFLGAGSAASGIGELIVHALMCEGMSIEAARKRVWFVDINGLVVKSRNDLNHFLLPFAHDHPQADFVTAIRQIRPHVLIGATGQPHTFTQEVVEEMCNNHARPIVFALSNPTSRSECTAEQAYKWSQGKVVFASGSPFDPVHLAGETYVPGQGNNVYVFPGIGLAAKLAEIERITEDMFYTAAQILANCVAPEDLQQGMVYPPLDQIRSVSEKIAAGVAELAWQKGLAKAQKPDSFEKLIEQHRFDPHY